MTTATPMTGSDYYTMVTGLLNNFQMDLVLFYQFLNLARTNREAERDYKVLTVIDTGQAVSAANTWQTQLSLPTGFVRPLDGLEEEGELRLFDGTNDIQDIHLIPFERRLDNKDVSGYASIDHANGLYYLLGTISKNYSVYFPFIKDFGDISSAVAWQQIPARFHPILAFDVAAMYRLGVDYDDINARNADANGAAAELLNRSMHRWDNKLALIEAQNLDYGRGDRGYRSGAINIRG